MLVLLLSHLFNEPDRSSLPFRARFLFLSIWSRQVSGAGGRPFLFFILGQLFTPP